MTESVVQMKRTAAWRNSGDYIEPGPLPPWRYLAAFPDTEASGERIDDTDPRFVIYDRLTRTFVVGDTLEKLTVEEIRTVKLPGFVNQ
jgi:hypothetical protein